MSDVSFNCTEEGEARLQDLWAALDITVDPDNGCAEIELTDDGGMIISQVDSHGDERRFEIEHDGDVFYSITRHDAKDAPQRWQYNQLSNDQLKAAMDIYFRDGGEISTFADGTLWDSATACILGEDDPCARESEDGNSFFVNSGLGILITF
jgi:hypothetical protein